MQRIHVQKARVSEDGAVGQVINESRSSVYAVASTFDLKMIRNDLFESDRFFEQLDKLKVSSFGDGDVVEALRRFSIIFFTQRRSANILIRLSRRIFCSGVRSCV